MKVLFVCHRVPFPPKRGGKIRPFNIIRHLSGLGHEVTVASLARTEAERREAEGLRAHCSRTLIEVVPDWIAWPRMLLWLPGTRPSSFGYFHSSRLQARIAEEIARHPPDLIFVHCSSVAPYVRTARAPMKVLDYGDMDSQKWREYRAHRPFPLSAGYGLEAMKLERMERLLSRDFDLCTCTTRAELQSLRNLGVRTPSNWFPNGVDTDFFAPAEEPYDPQLIAFVGRMDYFPNQQAVLQFCAQVWPELRRRRPGLKFQVIGAQPSEDIRALVRLPGVAVTGSVADVRPFVYKAALTIAPLTIARGTQNKILESMAMGVPVVSSPQAAGGVDAVPGEHILMADSPSQWIEAIEGLVASHERRAALAAAGRQRVLSHHSWAASMARLDGLISQVGKST